MTSPNEKQTQWPWPAQFVLALFGLTLALLLLVGLPAFSAWRLGQSSGVTNGMEVWGPLLSALLGLTTMTVSGIFVFMTFRIDRGARQEAQETAKNETERLVGIAAKDAIQKESRSAVSQITEETNEQVKNQIAEAHGDINKYVTVVEDRTKAQIKEAGAAVARIEGMVRDADNKVEKRVAEARTSLDARVKDITEEIGQRVTASIDRMEERITSIHGEIKDIRASIEDIDQRLSRLEPPSEVEG